MGSLSYNKEAEIIQAFNSTSRYLDDILNIDNSYFEGMVGRIYPPTLQLNKANASDIEAPFLDLHLSISNGFVPSKINDKRDDFHFDIVNFPFLDGDVPRSFSYGPTKDRKGLKPPKRTEKNFRAPKRTSVCHFYTIKHMF